MVGFRVIRTVQQAGTPHPPSVPPHEDEVVRGVPATASSLPPPALNLMLSTPPSEGGQGPSPIRLRLWGNSRSFRSRTSFARLLAGGDVAF